MISYPLVHSSLLRKRTHNATITNAFVSIERYVFRNVHVLGALCKAVNQINNMADLIHGDSRANG